MERRGSSCLKACLLATFSVLATPAAPVFGQPNGRWKSGEEVYNKVCAYCHDTGVGPVIKGRTFPPPAYEAFVRNGHLAMPSFRDTEIDQRALQALSEYLARSPNEAKVLGDPARGLALMATGVHGCQACHSIPGIRMPKGAVGPPLAGMARRAFIAGQLPNKPGVMVAFLQNPPALLPQTGMPSVGLSREQAIDIAAYLYTLETPNGL